MHLKGLHLFVSRLVEAGVKGPRLVFWFFFFSKGSCSSCLYVILNKWSILNTRAAGIGHHTWEHTVPAGEINEEALDFIFDAIENPLEWRLPFTFLSVSSSFLASDKLCSSSSSYCFGMIQKKEKKKEKKKNTTIHYKKK